MIALVLACLTVMTLDHHPGPGSPLEPARTAMGSVLGPVESGTSTVVRPVTAIGGWFHSRKQMQNDIAELQSQNSRLKAQQSTSQYERNQLAEYRGLTSAAGTLGQALVPAHVVAYGPAQSFSRTVTIDAGSAAGVRPDQTVLNDDGLVGRVLRVTRTTATVLLIVDTESVVGGRVGASMKVGFLRGRGGLGNNGTLDLQLVDEADAPSEGDSIVTWGSRDGAPYVAGVPDRSRHRGLRQPARVLAARGHLAVRRLRRPRRRRCGRPVGHAERPRRDRGGREPAVRSARVAGRRRRWSWWP